MTKKINHLTESLDDEPALDRAEKLEGLHARQQEVVTKQTTSDDPELAQAQEQLDEAQAKLRVFAATVASPTQAAALVVPTQPPATATKPVPTPTTGAGRSQVRCVRPWPRRHHDDLTWVHITTSNTSFVLPDTWRLVNVESDENGILTLSANFSASIRLADPPVIIIISSDTGGPLSLIKGNSVRLRDAGPKRHHDRAGRPVAATGEVGMALHHFVLSIR